MQGGTCRALHLNNISNFYLKKEEEEAKVKASEIGVNSAGERLSLRCHGSPGVEPDSAEKEPTAPVGCAPSCHSSTTGNWFLTPTSSGAVFTTDADAFPRTGHEHAATSEPFMSVPRPAACGHFLLTLRGLLHHPISSLPNRRSFGVHWQAPAPSLSGHLSGWISLKAMVSLSPR